MTFIVLLNCLFLSGTFTMGRNNNSDQDGQNHGPYTFVSLKTDNAEKNPTVDHPHSTILKKKKYKKNKKPLSLYL